MNDDYDTPWKEAITDHFPEFLAFYFPDAYAVIDWSRPHAFLDQELASLSHDAALGSRLLNHNPFALVTATPLLTELLYARQGDKRRIINLFKVIDWMMRLPEGLQARYMRCAVALQRRSNMTYLTSLERHAIGKGIRHGRRKGLKEGRQEGRQEGLAGLLLSQLARRYGPLDVAVAQQVTTADVEQLSAWALNFVDARSLNEVFGD